MIDDTSRQDGEQLAMPGFEPEPPAAETIKKQFPVVQFRMDFLRSPEDALLKWGQVENGRYRKWFTGHFDKLVAIVAQQTGADPAQIADKDKRTPEQQQLLLEAAAKQQIAHIDAFFDSLYMDAINTLEPLQGVYKDPGEIDFYTDTDRFNPDSEFISVKEQAVSYFFALHDKLKPTEKQTLTTEQKEELRGIYSRLDAFYLERTGGGSYDPEGAAILFAFIEREDPTPETAESIAAKLPLVQGIRPTAHTMPNNALMNALQQKRMIESPENAEGGYLPVANAKGRRKEITVFAMVTFDPGDTGITITDAKLTEYERQVSDAVISLWIEATQEKLPPIFTVDQIFRAMPGGGDKPSPNQKGAITKTLEKFSRLHIFMDATEEMRKRGIISDTQKYIVDENYLQWRRHTVTTRTGKKVAQGYEILGQPIMLTYSKLTKQLLTVPAKNIEIERISKGRPSGELIKMTPERQAMTGYIVRRLAVMEYDYNRAKENKRKYDAKRRRDASLEEKPLAAFREQSDTILFETLFAEAGVATANRDRTMDNRNFCFDVLDYQKAIGAIKDYKTQKKGRSITGVKIVF